MATTYLYERVLTTNGTDPVPGAEGSFYAEDDLGFENPLTWYDPITAMPLGTVLRADQKGFLPQFRLEVLSAIFKSPDEAPNAIMSIQGVIQKVEAAGVGGTAPHERAKPITGEKVVTRLQAGHGWSVTGAAVGVNLNNTTDYVLGSQALTGQTGGGGVTSYIVGPNPQPVEDFTGKAVRVWVKLSDPDNIAEFTFWACTNGSFANTYYWDVISYSASTRYIQPNTWTPVTLHFGLANVTGTPDRAALNRFKFQIRDKNGVNVSYGVQGFDKIPDSGAAYPNGCVSITFDDTWLTQFTKAKPVMDRYGFSGTAYIITGNVGTTGRMSLTQLKTLQGQGWEIATHAATQERHDANYGALSAADIRLELDAAKRWLTGNGFRSGDHFAYPGGHSENNVYPTAQEFFTSGRLVYDHNAETLPPADPLRIRCMQPSSTTPVASVTARVDKAKAGKAWLPLAFHDFVDTGATGVQFNTPDFATILAYINSSGVAVRTVGQALRGE